MYEVAIHRKRFDPENKAEIVKHAEELSELFSQGFEVIGQVNIHGWLVTTLRRKVGDKRE